MTNSLVLTIPELAALGGSGDPFAIAAANRLGIGAVSDEVRRAGLASLHARSLLDAEADDPQPATVVIAAIRVLATAEINLRFASIGAGGTAIASVHLADGFGVLVTPVGVDCFRLDFIDASGGVIGVLDSMCGPALTDSSSTLLIAPQDGATLGEAVALRLVDGALCMSPSGQGEVSPIASDEPLAVVAQLLVGA